jgi:hypothetical protein
MGGLDCAAYYLVKPNVDPSFHEPLSLRVRYIGPVVHSSKEVVCGSVGHLRQNDLVLFAGPPGQPAMGKIDRFCKCTSMSSPEDFFFVRYTEYAKVGVLEWAPCSGPLLYASCTKICWCLPYVNAGESKVIPFLPNDDVLAAWEL